MAPPRKLYTVSSLLMAALFAVSTSFQFNDIDWYFWIPLYAGGSAVNLMSCYCSCWELTDKTIPIRMAKLSLWLGIFLFVKVIVETFTADATGVDAVGIWSLDMRHKLVREKLGSGLVFVSMFLQLAANHSYNPTSLYFGIRVILGVALICVVSLVFLVLVTGSIIMHSASSTVQDDPRVPWQFKLAKYIDYGTVLVIGTNYTIFFVVFLLLFTSTILKGKTHTSSFRQHSYNKEEDGIHAYTTYGMAALVGIGYGLSLVFHLYLQDELKF